MSMNTWRERWLGATAALLSAGTVMAQVPAIINYQGRLLDGTNLVNGSLPLKVRLYSTAVGGSALYEDSSSVTVVDGLYSTYIGDNTSLGSLATTLTNAEVWIELEVNGTTLAPRERMVAVAYALGAQTANGVVANAITASMIATGAVREVHLAAGAVGAAAIANGAVGAAHLGSNAVTAAALAPGAVGSSAIADGAIGATDLGSNAVTTAALADGAVTAVKIRQVADVLLLATVTNPAPATGDCFGHCVAAVGSDRFVVGAYGDNTVATKAGSVHLYDHDGHLLAMVPNPAPGAYDYFGASVSGVGSNRFVAGAYWDDAGATDTGSAYLYDRDGHLLATVTNPAPAANDRFGISVAGVGPNRFVVGAHLDDTGATDAGSVCLYDWDGHLLATVTNPTPATGDRFGTSVAGVGADRFVVTAPSDDTGANGAGSAYLYDLDGHLLVTITNPAPAAGDGFGVSVAGVGIDYFVVGAESDDAGTADAGSAYLYDLDGHLLATVTNPAPAVSDWFGSSVAGVGSNRFLVGAIWDDAGAANAGSAYLYDFDGNLVATITNPAPAADDYFGSSVAGVGFNRFVVGAYGDDADAVNTGRAYLFGVHGGTYVEGLFAEGVRAGGTTADMLASGAVSGDKLAVGAVGSAAIADGAVGAADLGSNAVTTAALANEAVSADKIQQAANMVLLAPVTNPAPAEGDAFGSAVAGVGTDRFIVGASGDDEGMTGAGSAYLFDLDGHLLATITNPAPAAGDQFGSAVAGVGSNRFVVGADYDDTGATDAGSVYLYDYGGHLVATVTNPAPGPNSWFGCSVAAVGTDRFVVGAMYDCAAEWASGNAFLYDLDGHLLAAITNPAPESYAWFGVSVAGVGSDRFAVGAFGASSGLYNEGLVYLYDRNGHLLNTITNPSPIPADSRFGFSLAGVGFDRFVVGQSHQLPTNPCPAYLLDYDGGVLAMIPDRALIVIGGEFGGSVTGQGSDFFVLGSPGAYGGAWGAGRAYLYDIDGNFQWTIANPAIEYQARFGDCMAAVGSTRLVVGAPGARNTGVVYLYERGQHPDLIAEGVQDNAIGMEQLDVASVDSRYVVKIGGAVNRMQAGSSYLGSGTNAHMVFTVPFPVKFTGPPMVIAMADHLGANHEEVFAVTLRDVTWTNFTVNIQRVDQNSPWPTTQLTLDWLAWE